MSGQSQTQLDTVTLVAPKDLKLNMVFEAYKHLVEVREVRDHSKSKFLTNVVVYDESIDDEYIVTLRNSRLVKTLSSRFDIN